MTSTCKDFKPRESEAGGMERHQCPDCYEPMEVCDNCGGDYHEDPKVRLKCPSKRLNNTVRPEEKPKE